MSNQWLGAGLGAAGGFLFLGGFPGLIAGMSIGYTLFAPKEAKPAIEMEDYTNYNRLEVVPLLFGTDLCPSSIIWVNNFHSINIEDMTNKKKVKQQEDTEVKIPATVFLAQLAYVFCESCFINYPIINGLELGTILNYNIDLIDDYFEMEFTDTSWPSQYSANPPVPTAAVSKTFLYYNGPLGTDFTIVKNATNMGGSPDIPQITAECAYKAPYMFWAGDGGTAFDKNGYTNSYVNLAIYHFLGAHCGLNNSFIPFGAEDNSNDYVYFINREGAIGYYDIYTKSCTLIVTKNVVSYGYYGGMTNDQVCMRTENGRIYITTCRNEYKTNVGGIEQYYNYHGWTTNYTGYALYNPTYSLEYDLFYIDIATNTVTSIIISNRIIVPFNSSQATHPAIHMNTMEFSENYLYLICFQVAPYYSDSTYWSYFIQYGLYFGINVTDPYGGLWNFNQHQLGKMVVLKLNRTTGEYIDIAGEIYTRGLKYMTFMYLTVSSDIMCSATSLSISNEIQFSYEYIAKSDQFSCSGWIINDVFYTFPEDSFCGIGYGRRFWGKCIINGNHFVNYSYQDNNSDEDHKSHNSIYFIPAGGTWSNKIELVRGIANVWFLTRYNNHSQTYFISPFNYNSEIYFKFNVRSNWDFYCDLCRLDFKSIDNYDSLRMDTGYGYFFPVVRDFVVAYPTNYLGAWANCKYAILDYWGPACYSVSTYVDIMPTDALDITNSMMVQNKYTQLPIIQIAQADRDYCFERIPSNMNGMDIIEPRFLYSNCIQTKLKGYDLLQDILQTCRGFLTLCNGNLTLKIMKDTETPVIYFGLDENSFITSQTSDYFNRIYADFSDYPEDYWNGDSGIVFLNDQEYEFIVKDQVDTYITLLDNLSFNCPIGLEVHIVKDNIKQGSFTYSRKSQADKANRVILEYKSRFDKYREDVVEEENVMSIEENGLRIKTFTMNGIKRTTQAKRMVTFLQDYEDFVNWMCGFDTDLLGYMVCVGDIIGVTHPITGWQGKQFRIIKSSELQDFEVKLELEEYVPSIYHDYGTPTHKSHAHNWSKLGVPDQIERFIVIEDKYYNKLYFTFKEPSRNRHYWTGVSFFYNSSGTWTLLGKTSNVVPSVKLNGSIDKYSRIILIDYSTIYLTFGSSGSFWINNEEIYYNSMTEEGFYNCIRGYNGTVATSHVDKSYIIYKASNIYNIDIPRDMLATVIPVAGVSASFKAVSYGLYGVPAPYDKSPTYSLTIYGYGFLPLPVNSLGVIDIVP